MLFGHIDNKKLSAPDAIEVTLYGVILATICQCKRCNNCFFKINSKVTIQLK
jgi:hypothetical protein